jgi:uncharacterized protein (TIGR02466 family)
MEILNLFPTTIIKDKMQREFSEKEIEYINVCAENTRDNYGNVTSIDGYVLNHKKMKKLKKEILSRAKYYFNEILSVKDNVEPKITQSWLNYTGNGQHHHVHAHPNSFLSGVLYLNTVPDDMIIFEDVSYKQIKLTPKLYNDYNYESWQFPVETNDIVIFPSSLWHKVPVNNYDMARISLSFNIIPCGVVGDDLERTEWIID